MTLSRLPHDLCGRGMRTAHVIGWGKTGAGQEADVVRAEIHVHTSSRGLALQDAVPIKMRLR